ncbi:MAG: glycosyltransferase [Candidatus Bathyarchaeia archaeon]
MHASIIIPTYQGATLIPHALKSLGTQSFTDFEVIIVIKPSGDGTEHKVREICDAINISYKILIQKKGYFTHALNMGIKHAEGKIILFTDDDAVFPRNWVESHILAHQKFSKCAAVSGFDIQYPLVAFGTTPFSLAKFELLSFLRRRWQFIKPIFSKPHYLFNKYRLGIYITNDFKVTAGFGIPYKLCYSLPVKGVNMSFKRQIIDDLLFPVHPLLKVAPNNEQYFAAQLVLRGWDSIYNPDIKVYHIERSGLSKSPRNHFERILIQLLLRELLHGKP